MPFMLAPAFLPPTVLLSNLPTSRFPAAVTTDNRLAGRELATHLIDHGHRRILFVSGRFESSDRARLRYDGYREAMEAAAPGTRLTLLATDPMARIDAPFLMAQLGGSVIGIEEADGVLSITVETPAAPTG